MTEPAPLRPEFCSANCAVVLEPAPKNPSPYFTARRNAAGRLEPNQPDADLESSAAETRRRPGSVMNSAPGYSNSVRNRSMTWAWLARYACQTESHH